MALPTLKREELGTARAIFHLGQRFGRICNVLVTEEREQAEGDVTGELAIGRRHGLALRESLEREAETILSSLKEHERLTAFSVPRYVDSLIGLRRLHESLRGTL
jgi:hypothetical protein